MEKKRTGKSTTGAGKKKQEETEFTPVIASTVSSAAKVPDAKPETSETPVKEEPETERSPAFKELAEPKLPELAKENRARLQMQSPNRLFFYWSMQGNPYHRLKTALGEQTASYSLAARLINLKHESEEVHSVDAEGSWWFNVDADASYRAEIGFYSPSRPFVRVLYSNTVETPRKSPSTRPASDSEWTVTSDRFARVLDASGFSQDAFDVALVGDDFERAETATHQAFTQLVGNGHNDLTGIEAGEIRYALLALASGARLEDLRWQINARLFEMLQANAERFDRTRALGVLKEQFGVLDEDELSIEETGVSIIGASLVNFPRRLKQRRKLPKLAPVSSAPSSRVNYKV